MKVGDRVVCVRGHVDPKCDLKKDEIYYIDNFKKCGCGTGAFNVGIMLPDDYTMSRCTICGSPTISRIWWLQSNRFAPIQYNSATDELLNSIVEERQEIKKPEKIEV